MKTISLALALTLLASNAFAQTRTAVARRAAANRQATAAAGLPASGQQLSLRRVILYSNGVAYFERRGIINGNAEISLSFKQSQVDDVLKSLTVIDLGRGRIGAVSYNSSAPPAARMADIPFSIQAATGDGAEGGLSGVLRQLQGARVVVSTANRTATGAILTVEERRVPPADPEHPPTLTHALVIASENGELASFDLRDVRSVRLADEGARRDITEFANASASARRRDAKTIVITSEGAGPREMVVSYTIAAPIWRTTYRVVMDEAGRPFFQGWAIVDNVSEEDWTNVQLSLVSGSPVSFIQPVQQPLYRYRPVVPIPQDLNLDPQTHEPREGGSGPGGGAGAGGGTASGGAGAGGTASEAVSIVTDQARAAAPRNRGFVAGNTRQPAPPASALSLSTRAVTSLSDAITSSEASISTTSGEIGDLFQYRIDQPVTVRRDRSALIPILQTRMEGERVSVYNEAARRDRPMRGLLLRNTSALTLEGGALTVMEGDAYAGEALMERLKPGEERFISYALDLSALVTARQEENRQPAFLIRVVNGVLQAHYYQTMSKTYTLTNQTDERRIVYVEHPQRVGWQLSAATQRPTETTPSFYRFRVELAPRASVTLPVAERRALMESYALSNFTTQDLQLFVARRYIDDATRAQLQRILEIKERIAATEARLAAADAEVAEIGADQARLRENIQALGQTAEARQLIARYVAKANEQETRLEQIAAERRAAASQRAQMQAELDNAIRALALDRDLTQ